MLLMPKLTASSTTNSTSESNAKNATKSMILPNLLPKMLPKVPTESTTISTLKSNIKCTTISTAKSAYRNVLPNTSKQYHQKHQQKVLPRVPRTKSDFKSTTKSTPKNARTTLKKNESEHKTPPKRFAIFHMLFVFSPLRPRTFKCSERTANHNHENTEINNSARRSLKCVLLAQRTPLSAPSGTLSLPPPPPPPLPTPTTFLFRFPPVFGLNERHQKKHENTQNLQYFSKRDDSERMGGFYLRGRENSHNTLPSQNIVKDRRSTLLYFSQQYSHDLAPPLQ